MPSALCALALTLPCMAAPDGAAGRARFDGVIYDGRDHRPVPRARVVVTPPGDEPVVAFTDDGGRFSLDVARGPVAMEVVAGRVRYPLATPVLVRPGEGSVQVVLYRADEDGPDSADPPATGPGFWSEPGKATALIVGFAVLIGLLVEDITADEETGVASDFLPDAGGAEGGSP